MAWLGIGVGVTDLPVLQHTGGTPTPSPTVTAPVLTVVTDNATYPPQIDALLGEDTLVGDTARLQYSHDATFTTGVTTVDRVLSNTGTQSFNLTSITTGTNRFRAYIVRGGVVVSAASATVTHGPDDLPAILSAPTGASTGTTTGTIGVTTDTGEGAIYYVLTLTNSQPSAAQIKAGQNSAGAAAAKTGSISPTTTGAKTANVTGLSSATAYYTWFMQEDVALNQSNIVGASAFTTDAAPAFGISETAAPAIVLSPGGTSYTFTGQSIGAADSTRTLYIAVNYYNGGGALSGLTVAGVAATKLVDYFSVTNGNVYKISVPTGTTADIVVQTASSFDHVGIKVWRVVGGGLETLVKGSDAAFDSTDSVAGTIPAGGGAIVFAGIATATGTPVWTNATASSTTKGNGWTFMSASSSTAGATTISFNGFSGFPAIYITGLFIPPA